MKIKYILPFILFTLNLWSAQPDGIIEGQISDKTTGQPLIGVNIIVKNSILGAASDMEGRYRIERVPPGPIRLKATMMGYMETMQSDVQVESNRVTKVDFTLASTVVEAGETVTVSANYFEKDADHPVSTRTLSALEIRSAPGSAEDIFRILQSMPGIVTAGARSANLIVRGGAPDENRVLLDNLEIRSPLHFNRQDASMGIISIIEPSTIRNVEFITGGFPAEYGDKLSSVFEIRLKEGNRSRMNHDININMGGFNYYMDGPVVWDGNIMLSVRRGIFDMFTQMMDRPVQPRYWDSIAKASWQLGAKHQISLVGFYYLDDGERTGTMVDHGEMAKKYEYAKFDDFGSAIGLNWRYLFNDHGYALTTLEWTGNGFGSGIGALENRDLVGDDIFDQTLQLKTKITYRVSDHLDTKAGGFFKVLDAEYSRWSQADTLRTGTILPEYSYTYTLPQSYKTGAFAQMTWRPTARLALNTGIRAEHFDFTDENKVSPRLALTCHITDRTSLNAAYGIYYQSPSHFQIARDPANVDLKSSRADHYIAGMEHLLSPDTRFSVEAFYKEINNSFVWSDTTRRITNEGSGYAQGLEVCVQKKMSRNFIGSLSYTWSMSRRRDGDNSPEYNFDYDRRHNLILSTGYKPSPEWQFGLKVQASSGNPYTPVDGAIQRYDGWYVLDGEKNSAYYPDFYKLDVRVDRRFIFPAWTLNVYLELWNITNRENVLYYTYDVDNDGQITRYANADFPIMPMFGINVKF